MAHNIMERNGSHAMFCTGDRDSAWHKLGQRTPGAVTWQEAMKLADLAWPVSKHQLMGALPGTELHEVSAWGIFRNDDGAFLGSVGERVTVSPYRLGRGARDTLPNLNLAGLE